ncbi:MAG TPA: ATPase domain-containing protein [Vicinamibacterales bacterium]|jgi:circadian clock protein KaiC|nr:ATPase domain-containing protein [Vicinamibacterales bacterium]
MNHSATISTGIPGLNCILSGGLTPHRTYLVEGRPGSGKTTLALQFLLEGRREGESTLYVTLSETTSELTAVAASHGWALDGIDIFQLTLAETLGRDEQYTLYHPAEIELGATISSIVSEVERIRPSRVVFDSLSEMRLMARDPLLFRRQILALKTFFSGRACTVLLLDDQVGDRDLQVQSIAHGVIQLEQQPFDYGRARRRIGVVKFRGVAAVEGFHDFVITRGGLKVFPQLTPVAEGVGASETLSSGVPELDTLLGGGVSYGTSTLLVGPAGTGKSTVAALFVARGAATAPGRIFLFDERRSTLIARCDAMGMRFSDHIAAGAVAVEQIEPGLLSPGEFSYRVHEAVEREGARIIVIDSINGYLNAINHSAAPLARIHELLSYLAERNVVTILIGAQHGILGSAMSAPIDVSYLVDSVALFRFFEAQGSVRRAISVVKKRTGAYESTIREFQIGPSRLRVGAALSEFRGVLTGVPIYTGPSGPLLSRDD